MKVYVLMHPEEGCCDNVWEEIAGVYASPESVMATIPRMKEGRREVWDWIEDNGGWTYTRVDVKHPGTYGYGLRERRIVAWEVQP